MEKKTNPPITFPISEEAFDALVKEQEQEEEKEKWDRCVKTYVPSPCFGTTGVPFRAS